MATIKDVAKLAGVSVTTVSRALNGHFDVSAATRRKIEEIAKQLNYTPNAAARSLVTNRSRTLGVFFVSVLERSAEKDNFAIQILCGIDDFANSVNYGILFFVMSTETQRKKSLFEIAKERNLDGILVWGLKSTDPFYMEISQKTMNYPPISMIDMIVDSPDISSVISDNVGGARTATQHLIDMGHRHIAMINGLETGIVSAQRLAGYRSCLEEAGISYIASRVVDGQFSEEGGHAAMRHLLKHHPEVTAVFCASDLMAYGAMQALEKTGRLIPQGMSIVGFDNLSISAYYSPPLTSVHQNKYQLGYEAAQLLYSKVEGKESPQQVVLDTELIIRSSTSSVLD